MDKLIVKEKIELKDILVSIIVPVYNAEKYIKKCLDSLINQTYSNLEIICINDGSTDHTREILEFYRKKDSRIKVVSIPNSGPSVARNMGLDLSTGEYIHFVDADDFIQDNTYEILIECISEFDWDDIIFGGNIIGKYDDYIGDILNTKYKKYRNTGPYNVVFNEKSARPYLWLHFIKKSILEQNKKIRFKDNMELGEDQIFLFDFLPRAKNLMVIVDKLYNYRRDVGASITNKYDSMVKTKTDSHFEIVENIINDWKYYGFYNYGCDDLWSWITNFIFYTIWQLPDFLRNEYARQFKSLIDFNEVPLYMISENEKSRFKEIISWATINTSISDFDKEINFLNMKIEDEKKQIDETLKSKAFKLGTLLTPAGARMDFDAEKK